MVHTPRNLIAQNLCLRQQLLVLERRTPLCQVKNSTGRVGSDAKPDTGAAAVILVMGFWTFLRALRVGGAPWEGPAGPGLSPADGAVHLFTAVDGPTLARR